MTFCTRSFPLRISAVHVTKSATDLVTFTEEILDGKLHFLCSDVAECVRLSPATLLKRRLWHRCFPVNFVKFPRTPFYIERL